LAGCGPTKLYAGSALPADRIATVRASGIHRLEKVDKREVKGRVFALEPGRHLLEFRSSSLERITGTTFPLYSVDCYADVELNAGHVYEFEGDFSRSSPEIAKHDGLNWSLHQLDARLIDSTEAKEVEGLVCPYSCRAVGRGVRYSWMRCDKYFEAVSGATVANPESSDAPSVPEIGERVSEECARRGHRRDAVCVIQLMTWLITAKLGNGEILLFVPQSPDGLLPDSKEKAVQSCQRHAQLAPLGTCLGGHGWILLPAESQR
jgi:hypothetical protein